jgi:putative peptidoglycan lipid II flippase
VSLGGRALARAGLVVTAAYLVSRLLGWARLVAFGTIFGASPDLDAYFAAFRIPDAIFQLVAAGALGSALIPVLAGLFAQRDDDEAWKVVSTVVNLMLLAVVPVSVAVALAAPAIMPLITPGFDTVQTELTVRLSRIMLLSPILLALGAVATSALNATGRFTAAAVSPLLYNAAIIVAAVALAPALGVEALALGVVAGSFLALIVQVPSLLKSGLRYDLHLDLRHEPTRTVLLLMAPRALGLGATQITFIVNTTLASGLAAGAISAYNIAFAVFQIPIGVIGVPLGVVLLPSMARALATGAVRTFGLYVVRSLRLLLFVMFFFTAVAMVLRRQIVTLLFDYGQFDAQAVDLTANTLLFFLGGLAADALIAVLARAFYAGRETRIPVAAAMLAVAVNVTVSIATIGSLGLSGLALGIAAGAWVEAVVLAVILARRTAGMSLAALGRAAGLFLGGSLLAAAAAAGAVRGVDLVIGVDPGKVAILAQAVAGTLAATAVYVAYALLFRVPELTETAGLIGGVLRRGRQDA